VITEIRRYRIKPGRLESWLAFFAEASRENERHGIRVEYAGVDRETGTFVWLRSFADEADRQARKAAFYGSDWWIKREAFAMDHVLEYEVTFLDAAIVNEGGRATAVPWPAPGEPAGSRGDGPPDGWAPSTRRTFVPIQTEVAKRAD
jgi:NIPSNAP protein